MEECDGYWASTDDGRECFPLSGYVRDEYRGAPSDMVVIYETDEPGYFNWSGDMNLDWKGDEPDQCAVYPENGTQPNYFSYWVYDRHGNIEEVTKILPVELNVTVQIPVHGDPPWLFVGDYPRCRAGGEKATGISNGIRQIDLDPYPAERHYGYVDVTVPIGDTIGRATYEAPMYSAYLSQLGPWGDRDGHPTGTIQVIDSHGYTKREDVNALFASEITTQHWGYHHIAGGWTIELELPHPAIMETTWQYLFDYVVITDDICQHGFEWPICG